MPHVTSDRVKEESASNGAGNFTLTGAGRGFVSISSVANLADTFYYTIASHLSDEWEVGLGTYSAVNTLERTTVYHSSNLNNKVNFSAGGKDVFITAPADRFLQSNASNNYGNFTAGTIAATLTGNALTATSLATSRTIGLSGVTATATSFNGSANILIPVTAVPATLLTGIVPDASISGSYTGMVNLTGSGSVDFNKFLGLATDLVSTPSYTWTGDTTTGFYRPTTSQIGVAIAGVQRGLFTGSGLTVTGSISATGGFAGNATTATNSLQLGGITAAQTLQYRGNIASTNIDSAIENGFYTVSYTGYSDGVLTFNSGGSVGPVQLKFSYTGLIEFRNKTDSNLFNGWKTIVTNANFNQYAPSLTGVSASGTWGINITGNASSVTNGVYTIGNQTIGGIKTFSQQDNHQAGVGIVSNNYLNLNGNNVGLGWGITETSTDGFLRFQTRQDTGAYTNRLIVDTVGNFSTTGGMTSAGALVTGGSNGGQPVLGSASSGYRLNSANSLYGLNVTTSNNGDVFFQAMRFDSGTATYAIRLNQAGGNVVMSGGVVTASSTGLAVIGKTTSTQGFEGTLGATTPSSVVATTIRSNLGINNDAAGGNQIIQTSTNSLSQGLGLWAGGIPRIYSTGTLFIMTGAGLNQSGLPTVGSDTLAISPTGLAVTGRVSSTGQNNAQALEVTGTAGAYASSGGASISYNGSGLAVIRAYSNSSGTGAGQIDSNIAGTVRSSLSSTGLAVTGGISATGNVGIGVIPSSNNASYTGLQTAGYAAFGQRAIGTADLAVSWNADIASGNSSGSGYVYRNTGNVASSYEQNGGHRWYNAPVGTAGNTISFTERMCITQAGNVGIGTSAPSFKLQVAGSFAATSKSFLIDHPTKPGMQLRYGSLESPYHGIRLTGEAVITGKDFKVNLPDYIHELVHQEGSQVQLTNIRHGRVLYVTNISVVDNYFTVSCDRGWFDKSQLAFYWSFTAIRKDIESMQVEIENGS